MNTNGMWIMDDIYQVDKMIRDIKIKPVLNGFIVDIGCQELVFNRLTGMIKSLEEYYGADEPDKVEKKWLGKSINSGKLGGENAARAAPTSLYITADLDAGSPSNA